ncbi:hypothetical protein STEG23_030804 [Scotinomys teguina]
MDSFMESLNRLKEAHEKEVLGLQNKLLELNSERCRDAQRVEELFAKNHQLREQQKALKENLRVLENRLRAGLCDRCMVTQELARKKQLELENAHLQSLQHLCILTNEMNGLREENKLLKEEMKRLQNLGDKAAPQAWEGTSEPPSPMPLPSPGNRKGATENPAGGPEEAEEEQPGTDKVSSHKTSPVARISPAANLPEPRVLDMSPQCISNQLHSTVAVLRPGSRACPPDCGTANGTPPPTSTRSSPPSPAHEHGPPVDSFLRVSRPSAIAYETLKRSLQTDRLCLLNRHLSLHLQSPHSSPLAQGLKTREAEAWEEPGALVGMQDPRLEGALHLLLVQQQLRARARAGSARLRVLSTQEDVPSSPPAGSDSENSESETPRTALSTEAQPDGWHPQSTGQCSPPRKEIHVTTQDCPPDKPLDLSDRGRCRDIPKSTGQPLPLSTTVVHTPSPQLPILSRPVIHSPHALSNGSTQTRAREPEEHFTPKDTSHPLPGTHASLTSPGRTAEEAGGRPRSVPHLQRPDTDGTTEPCKVRSQRPELEQLEESDSKVGLTSEASAEPSMLGEGHAEDHRQGLQQKRKQTSDLQDKGIAPASGADFSRPGRKLRTAVSGAPLWSLRKCSQQRGKKGKQYARRRVTSQRCSLEFLEDAVGCASVQRTKHASGSPRHKGLKKTHFIKNMRQYDTKNSRIVLICAKRSLCAAFSVLPYGEGLRISDLRVDSQKQRHPSGGVSVSSEMVFELEGVELGADGKVVSYAKFLYPTNALVTHKNDSHGLLPQPRPSIPRAPPGSRHKSVPTKSTPAGTELGNDGGDAVEYNPNLLDDPQWPCGKHKRVLIFASYMTTVIEYVKPADLKKDMNETFREKFPHIKLTLSKIRSLKREMRNLSEECSLEPVTVSMAYVYFEKLVLQGKLNKQNRKLCAGACVLLAAKISSDLRKSEVKQLIDKLEERFRFNRKDLIGFEFTVLVALELALYLPENQVLPHYRRLTQQF